MRLLRYFTLIILLSFLISCKSGKNYDKPNIILIMADDMGYECLSCYGSTSYQTPILDKLASEGIQFNQCISQPLCTPSRVKIMTGMYNYRNYDYFGHLNNNSYTFGNLLKDAGYATCIVGKWQLNGLAYKDEIPYWNDNNRPVDFGFDEYALWQLTRGRNEGERFADPLIEQNGRILDTSIDDYGPDIFTNYLLDFMDRNQKVPFFVYFPMVLVHEPFVPTPDSESWTDPDLRYKKDTSYFREMVSYTDKIVGKIVNKLELLNIDENTLIIFTADNGTHPTVYSNTVKGVVKGGKGNTIDAGVHVPLIAYWPDKIREGFAFNGLIEFSDFFPTLADIVKVDRDTDGKSFYPLLTGAPYRSREKVFVHYDPRWGKRVNQFRNQFAQTNEFKLYQDGKFFNILDDILEKSPLNTDSLDEEQHKTWLILSEELQKHPRMIESGSASNK
jgi:arylsulfatase A